MPRKSSGLIKLSIIIGLSYSVYAYNSNEGTLSGITEDVMNTVSPTPFENVFPTLNNYTVQDDNFGNDTTSISSKSPSNGSEDKSNDNSHLHKTQHPNVNQSQEQPPSKPTTNLPTKSPTIAKTVNPTKKAAKKPTKSPSQQSTDNTDNKELIIPKIYSVSAPGKLTYNNEDKTVAIDASNTKEGYVGIRYSGDNTNVKIIITHDDDKYTYNTSKGDYSYYPLQMGNGIYSINIYENITGNQYMPIMQQEIDVDIIDENKIFLHPNKLVWFTQDSNTVTEAAKLCQDYDSDFEKVSAIFEFVTNNISYDYDKAANVHPGYVSDVDDILKSKKGICFDYASVFAAMCRSQGIPTKLAIGYVNQNSSLIHHAWNYVYTKDKGWITTSFYVSQKGYYLVDPTFYSSINDKTAASEFINNNSNYQVYEYY